SRGSAICRCAWPHMFRPSSAWPRRRGSVGYTRRVPGNRLHGARRASGLIRSAPAWWATKCDRSAPSGSLRHLRSPPPNGIGIVSEHPLGGRPHRPALTTHHRSALATPLLLIRLGSHGVLCVAVTDVVCS